MEFLWFVLQQSAPSYYTCSQKLELVRQFPSEGFQIFIGKTIDKFVTKVRLSIFDSWFRREMADVQTRGKVMLRHLSARIC